MKFIDKKDLKENIFSHKFMDFPNISWATSSKFSDRAKNHCAATAVTNLSIFYANKGYKNLFVDGDIYKTFMSVYYYIGNGPRIIIANDIKKIFKKRGYDIDILYCRKFEDIKNSIDNNRPVLLLLADKLFSWHWVMGLGYYESDNKYVRIVDGWNNSSDKFYKFNGEIKFLYGLSVNIKKKSNGC